MSDEPIKKPGARPDKSTLDKLQAELSADLKTGEDPLYYDWTRVAEAPPSEAAYVPPMQIQTNFMDTRDLAAVIGREAAEAARHAPLPGHTVVIDDGSTRAEQAFEVDTFGDSIPTEEMHGAPISDGRYAVTRRLAAVGGQRGRSGWIWIASAVAAVLGCAAFVWTQHGSSSDATQADTSASSDLGAGNAPKRPPVPSAPESIAAPSTPRSAVSVAELPVEPGPVPPSHIAPRKVTPSTIQQPEHLPSRRSPTSGSSTRSRLPSPQQPTPPKATGDEVADPILSEHPGY